MCLYSKREKPMVARVNITCYKVLGKVGYRRYFTPYFCTPVSIGKALVAMHPNHLPLKGLYNYLVTSEGVHAYTTKEEAVKHKLKAWAVAQCTIPAGTEYWEGMYGDIAARRMLIEKIV